MAVTVVALIRGKSGTRDIILDAFRDIADDVHAEQGCELYAAHSQDGGDTVVMVERWTTAADLEAHSAAEPVGRLNAVIGEHLEGPAEVLSLEAVPMGDPVKGAIPA